MSALLTAAMMLAAASAAIPLNVSALAQAYEGIGALSGGGGVTRLLIDYPPAIQQDILDVLFLPGAGASLQIIKVEIGGDTQSTEGTEQSHEHYRGDLNCSRGYEWWVVAEAKKRNPDIVTFGLSWGVPGWIGGGSYYTADNLKYHVDWVYCANSVWGFEVDNLGIWNERGADPTWTKQLRVALDDAGFQSTRIVAADTDWGVVNDMAADPAFAAAVDIIGAHYPNQPPPGAFAFNKSLWASEMWDLGKVDDWEGAQQLAKDFSQQARWGMSASIVWCLIYSWYAPLPFSHPTNTNAGAGHSVLTAAEPWSGHYELNPTISAIAHHTQFAQRGWTYLAGGMGAGTLPGGGSFVTLVNTHTPSTVLEFSVVLETTGAAATQAATFSLSGLCMGQALPSVLHVWCTTEAVPFSALADVPVAADGSFSLSLSANAFYSITTTSGQGGPRMPAVPIPPSAPFPFPYADDFEGYAAQAYASYFCDEGGIFQVMPLPPTLRRSVGTDGTTEALAPGGSAYYQLVTVVPIVWEKNPDPYTLIGNFNGGATFPAGATWTDYTVKVSAAFGSDMGPTPGVTYAAVSEPCSATGSQAFRPTAGTWGSGPVVLQSVQYPTLCLGVIGQSLYPGANDVGLVDCASSSATTLSSVAVGTWVPLAGSPEQIQDAADGQCLDILSSGSGPGTRLLTYPCKESSDPTQGNQKWTVGPANGTAAAYAITSLMDGQCVDVRSLPVGSTHLTLGMRINTYERNGAPINGYTLSLLPSANATTAGSFEFAFGGTVLRGGSTSMPIVGGVFYHLALTASGQSVSASLNGATLASVAGDGSSAYGMAAFGSGWHTAWFDDFAVQA